MLSQTIFHTNNLRRDRVVVTQMQIIKMLKTIGPIAMTVLLILAVGLIPLLSSNAAAYESPIQERPPVEPRFELEYVPGQIIVKFKAGTPSVAEASLNESLGATVVHTSPRARYRPAAPRRVLPDPHRSGRRTRPRCDRPAGRWTCASAHPLP